METEAHVQIRDATKGRASNSLARGSIGSAKRIQPQDSRCRKPNTKSLSSCSRLALRGILELSKDQDNCIGAKKKIKVGHMRGSDGSVAVKCAS